MAAASFSRLLLGSGWSAGFRRSLLAFAWWVAFRVLVLGPAWAVGLLRGPAWAARSARGPVWAARLLLEPAWAAGMLRGPVRAARLLRGPVRAARLLLGRELAARLLLALASEAGFRGLPPALASEAGLRGLVLRPGRLRRSLRRRAHRATPRSVASRRGGLCRQSAACGSGLSRACFLVAYASRRPMIDAASASCVGTCRTLRDGPPQGRGRARRGQSMSSHRPTDARSACHLVRRGS
jgi:hypothetical protein